SRPPSQRHSPPAIKEMTAPPNPFVQSFRIALRCLPPTKSTLNGGLINPILTIATRLDASSGVHFVLWREVEGMFEGAKYTTNKGCLVPFLEDDSFKELDPPRIPCDPDTVLEVVVTLAWPTASTTAAPTALDTERLLIPATNRSNDALQVEVAVPQTELAEVNEAASILQHLTLNRQTAFQNQIQTILGKTFQFYEKPPPRLFFILPTAVRRMETIVKFVPQDFRLYFLCECGEHTARTGSSEMDRVHLTNHHGYDIARPEALLQSFGPHILAVMRGMRSGTKTVSVVIPPLVSSDMVQKLNDAEVAVGRTWVENEPHTQESVQNMAERTISYLEDMSIRQAVRGQPSNSPELMNTGSIEKADSELLRSFLSVPDEDKSLANLYRMKDSGHIKLVFQSHFRQKHPKQTPERLLNLMKKVVDTFSEREGRVHMSLKDEAEANAFYSALTETRGVQELHVSLE
ncbi:hypothetical protein BGZ74_009386, partial [Mortierella antarctica]